MPPPTLPDQPHNVFTALDILLGFIVPFLVTATILALAWRPWRVGRARDARWAGALAVAAGYAIAYARLVDGLGFPPPSSDAWIIYLLLPCALVGALGCWMRPGPAFWLATVPLLFGLLVWLLLRPVIGTGVTRFGAAWRVVVFALVMTIWWFMLNHFARHGPRLLAPAVALLVCIGAAVVLGDNGLLQRGGITCAALAVVLAAVLLVGAITRRFTFAGGGTLAASFVLLGTIAYGWFYIYPEPGPRLSWAIVLLLVSPLLAWAGSLRALRRRNAWQRGLVSVFAVFLGVAGAVALAESAPAEKSSTSEELSLAPRPRQLNPRATVSPVATRPRLRG